MNSGIKEWLLKIVLLLCSLLFSFLVIEFYLRFFSKETFKPRTMVINGRQYEWSGETYLDDFKNGYLTFQYCYANNPRGFFDQNNCVSHTFNSLGFREKELDYTKPKDTFRIIFLGDSFALGEGVVLDKIFVERLKAMLDQKKINGKRVEIFNLGAAGRTTAGEMINYLEIGRKLNPDLIALQWNTNDFPVTAVSTTHTEIISGNYIEGYDAPKIIKWSVLGRLLWHTLKTWQVSNEIIRLTNFELVLGKKNFNQILEFQQTVLNDKADFLLVIFPEIIRLNDYPYADVIKELKNFLDEHHIPIIDLLPALSKYKDKDLWVHPSDHHPNEIAHQLAAEEIFKYLDFNYLDH